MNIHDEINDLVIGWGYSEEEAREIVCENYNIDEFIGDFEC